MPSPLLGFEFVWFDFYFERFESAWFVSSRNDPCGRRWKIEIVHHMVHCISSNRTNNLYALYYWWDFYLQDKPFIYISHQHKLISSIANYIPSDWFSICSAASFPEENQLLDAWFHDHEFRSMDVILQDSPHHKTHHQFGEYLWYFPTTSSKSKLFGGFKYVFYFHPEHWGNDPVWQAYFSKGLVQPPTSIGRHHFCTSNVPVFFSDGPPNMLLGSL